MKLKELLQKNDLQADFEKIKVIYDLQIFKMMTDFEKTVKMENEKVKLNE